MTSHWEVNVIVRTIDDEGEVIHTQDYIRGENEYTMQEWADEAANVLVLAYREDVL